MQFETGDLYHVYNQGNNSGPIFFTQDNYFFFIEKMRKYILPYADILAWCLMPNHFHLMVYVHTLEIEVSADEDIAIDGVTPVKANSKRKVTKKRDFNNAIGILLRSYTRAIHNQEEMTGSLFRNPTHAKCLTTPKGITPAYFNTAFGTVMNRHILEEEYPQVCFNYIHDNPVTSKLVKHAEDWTFSSYRDYCGKRNGQLINKERAREFGLY